VRVGQGSRVFSDLPVSPSVFLKELRCVFPWNFIMAAVVVCIRHQLENKNSFFSNKVLDGRVWSGNWTPRLAQGNVNTDRSKRQSSGTNIGINSTFHHVNRPVAKRKETQWPIFHREEYG